MTSLATTADSSRPRILRPDTWRRAARALPRWVPSFGSWRSVLAAPFVPTTWRSVAHLALTALVGAAVPLALLFLGASFALAADPDRTLTGVTFWATMLLAVALIVIAVLLGAPFVARGLRWLTAQYDSVAVAAPRPLRLDFSSPAAFARSLFASQRRWLVAGKGLACGLVAVAGFGILFALGFMGARYLAIPFVYEDLRVLFDGLPARPSVALPGGGSPWGAVVIGVALVYLAAFSAQGAASLTARTNRALLAPGSDEVLEERVDELTQSRSDVVDAADSERRRIERDLHDGAQQRLVALSVDLGLARRAAQSDPAVAFEAIDHAQTEVEASLRELRDLVRGIYPQVLTDRGLHEAVEALVTRAPLPTALESPGAKALADVPAPIVSAAYFVVSECLANAAKYAGAATAIVRVDLADARLSVSVSDDGSGGAKFTHGRGLDGLRKRVTALDGSLILTSPAGDGTSVTAVFPCHV